MKTIFSKICFLGIVGALALNAFCSCEDKPIDVNAPEDPFISDADTILIDGEYPVPHPEIAMKIYDREVLRRIPGHRRPDLQHRGRCSVCRGWTCHPDHERQCPEIQRHCNQAR